MSSYGQCEGEESGPIVQGEVWQFHRGKGRYSLQMNEIPLSMRDKLMPHLRALLQNSSPDWVSRLRTSVRPSSRRLIAMTSSPYRTLIPWLRT